MPEREGGKETRPSPVLFLADARDDEEREEEAERREVFSVPTARDRARGRMREGESRQARRCRYDRARAGRTRKRGERAARSLGSRFPRLRSIPPPSLASLFPSSPPSARTTAPHSAPLCRSSSRVRVCSSFDLPLSVSHSLRLARRPSSLSSDSLLLLLLVHFLSLFLRRLAFLHVQQDVAAISERGRVYIHTRINHRGRRSRGGERRERTVYM